MWGYCEQLPTVDSSLVRALGRQFEVFYCFCSVFCFVFYLGMVLLYCHWFWYHSLVEKLAVATQMLSM